MFKETKKRSIFKAVSWRVVAVLNSWAILSLELGVENLTNALLMNITGFALFYGFERLWNLIKYGKIKQ